jgi:hypothetical protein
VGCQNLFARLLATVADFMSIKENVWAEVLMGGMLHFTLDEYHTHMLMYIYRLTQGMSTQDDHQLNKVSTRLGTR